MRTYQVAVYKAYYIDEQFGWEAEGTAFFESDISENPTICMQQFDYYEPVHPNWFATMRMMDDGEVIEEEWFDSSVIAMESM